MRIVVCALFVLICGCALSVADPRIRPADLAPEIKDALALRSRYNVPIPESDAVIYVDSIAVHHLREEQSAVGTRDTDGHWHLSRVREEGPGLLKVEQHLDSKDDRILSDTEGRELDKLLEQPDLYRETSQQSEPPGIGAFIHTMEIDTPAGHMVIRWTGRLLGKAGAVADLVIGAG